MKHACRKASRLASDALERELSGWEAFRLRFHLLICAHCRNFRKSLRLMHETMARIRASEHDGVKLSPQQRRELLRVIESEIGSS